MIKLTRLNNHVVAINPDHIGWIEATPDTTLFLIGGDKILVRESVDELIMLVIEFRRLIRAVEPPTNALGPIEGDPPRTGITRKGSDLPSRITGFPSRYPSRIRGDR